MKGPQGCQPSFGPRKQGKFGLADSWGGANAGVQGDWESSLTVIVPGKIDPPPAGTLARQLEDLIARVAPVDGFAGAGPGAAS